MGTKEVAAIHAEIEKLAPHEKLRLAADLLEAHRPGLAHAIAERVVLELGAWLALEKARSAKS